MDMIELLCNEREVKGKKVKILRQQGITPVSLFGHDVQPQVLQCDTIKLARSVAQAGETRLISLKINKGKKPKLALVREVQRSPMSKQLLHVAFYAVKLEEKVVVQVPIVFVGEAPALNKKGNTLMRELDTLSIECLPNEIPNKIEVDISSLAEANQALRVKDIDFRKKITVLDHPERVIVTVIARAEEKVIPKEIPVVTGEEAKEPSEEPKPE